LNQVINGDCLVELPKIKTQSVDLVFVDPPFGINYKYDGYKDNLKRADYSNWSVDWVMQIHRILKSNGTFWLASGDKYVSLLDELCSQFFYRRSWVIWHYTFGQNQKDNWSKSHTHLLYYVRNRYHYTFNDKDIRVPSLRQLKYKDKRANPLGKIPDDVWNIPRLCGTFKERVAHSCQMPLQVLDNIIKTCSNKGDLVLDPMAGSCTTLVSAKNLGRNYIGIELSKKYVDIGNKRLGN